LFCPDGKTISDEKNDITICTREDTVTPCFMTQSVTN
jgi:hypothetical protein